MGVLHDPARGHSSIVRGVKSSLSEINGVQGGGALRYAQSTPVRPRFRLRRRCGKLTRQASRP
jgi:hypothetical protein